MDSIRITTGENDCTISGVATGTESFEAVASDTININNTMGNMVIGAADSPKAEIKPFVYLDDVKLNDVSVREMLAMDEDEFTEYYKTICGNIAEILNVVNTNEYGGIYLPAATAEMDTIERVRLERRIQALEKNCTINIFF